MNSTDENYEKIKLTHIMLCLLQKYGFFMIL